MTVRSALIVGAGIAGCTLGYFLGRAGIASTVVERAPAHRSSGSPVDVRGPALAVAERMRLLPSIQAAATRATRLLNVDRNGRPIGSLPIQTSRNGIEIPRSTLAGLLATAARDYAEFRYGDTVSALRADPGGVDVTFALSAPRRFDLVVGADGLHSTIRQLVFGPEEQFTRHFGLYLATVDLGRPSADPETVFVHNAPGRAVAVHPNTGREGGAFIFRHPRLPPEQARDPGQQVQLLRRTYAGVGWRSVELLDRLASADDWYFDAVCRVRLPSWWHRRTVLVGDAADCVSLFGNGSSLAMSGAAMLADCLAAEPADLGAALGQYELRQRRQLRRQLSGAALAGHLLVPQSRLGLLARNAGLAAYAALASLAPGRLSRDRIG